MRNLVSLLRPSHWVKNLLVFAPLIFAQQYHLMSLEDDLMAWGAFCLIASSIYIVNDIFDRESDKLHPEKRQRAIASGAVSVPQASVIAVVLVVTSLALSNVVHIIPYIAGYAIINVLYSFYLKRVLILDVMIIAIGFVLRVLVGGAAINVAVSHWIILCTFFISLFLGFGKRKNETVVLSEGSKNHRKVLEHYTESFLNQLLGISAAMTILSYALYTIDPETITRFGSDRLVYTTPLVVYGIFHYFHLIYNRSTGGDPTKIFLKDKPTIIVLLLWLASVVAITRY